MAARVIKLFDLVGDTGYDIGEAVTQRQHALQAAKCAVDTGAAEEVVIAALLHDIGHLIGLAAPLEGSSATYEHMGDCGIVNHEGLGQAFCNEVGLPHVVGQLVRSHVEAKRYLCCRNAGYHAKLSEASKTTLSYQGGPMTPAEADAFEANPLSKTILKMRTWDEAAKVPDMVTPPLDAYLPIIERLIAAAGVDRRV